LTTHCAQLDHIPRFTLGLPKKTVGILVSVRQMVRASESYGVHSSLPRAPKLTVQAASCLSKR